jgi:hypothetical protein
MLKGNKVECYGAYSPNASITSTILTNMLRCVNSHGVYYRSNSTNQVLILDGCHSRMDLEFLDYINQPENYWNVVLGVPYSTHIWQVADSSQVNGNFKIKIAKEKGEYMTHKTSNTSGMVITNIVPIVNGAYARSFAIVASARKAIAE